MATYFISFLFLLQGDVSFLISTTYWLCFQISFLVSFTQCIPGWDMSSALGEWTEQTRSPPSKSTDWRKPSRKQVKINSKLQVKFLNASNCLGEIRKQAMDENNIWQEDLMKPKSDWLYSLKPKMEKLYTVSKNKELTVVQIMSTLLPNSDLIEESGENH